MFFMSRINDDDDDDDDDDELMMMSTCHCRRCCTQIAVPGRDHAMFRLGLSARDERCHNYIQLINATILRSRAALQSRLATSELLSIRTRRPHYQLNHIALLHFSFSPVSISYVFPYKTC